MKCFFCNESAGFLKAYHEGCYEATQNHLRKFDEIVTRYYNKEIDYYDAKEKIIKWASSNIYYENYVKSKIYDMTSIRTNENVIYVEAGLTLYESKNRCKMVETGYRYERNPVWRESSIYIGNNLNIAYTENALYILNNSSSLRYEYSKIVNLGYDEKKGHSYFDVKTASPYPHRFLIESDLKDDKIKAQNVYMILHCLSRY